MAKFRIDFTNKEQIKNFREPLNRIGFANGVGIILNISKDTIKVNAVSETNNILAQVKMDVTKVCGELTLEDDKVVDVGILEYENFLNCFDMFGDEFSISYDGEKFEFKDKNQTSCLEYYSTRTDTIKECGKISPKKFGTSKLDFILKPKDINRIMKAFSVLGEDLLKIEASADSKEIQISIASKGKSNSYSFSLAHEKKIEEKIEMLYSHDHLMNLFKCNCDIDISITDRVMMGVVKNDAYSIRYYISRRT